MFAEIKARIGISRPAPFRGCVVDQVYDFYKKHLRHPQRTIAVLGYTARGFNFIVVDGLCVQSKPQQWILCGRESSDAGQDI